MKWILKCLLPCVLIGGEAVLIPANPFVPKAISMVSLDGKTVLTNDGSNYKVHPEDRKISMGWTKYTGTVIISLNRKKDEYPFTITNKGTGEFVRAEAMIFHDKIINP
ncbi:MAG: hypothetical protein FJZ59_06740 [Chlamydiae bacterium]|nr:hypothetical protein [Chlamydiota bacterium]